MNLSKMVAQDVPLFLSLLADLFPNLAPPPKAEYPQLEAALKNVVESNKLVYHPTWVGKVLQLYDTTLVRHGIMLVGPSGGGKTQIFKCLRGALDVTTGITHKDVRLNPKAIRAQEMYGEMDPLSGEWTTGGWVRKQPASQQAILRTLIQRYLGTSSPTDPGQCFDWLTRNVSQVMTTSRVGTTSALCELFKGLTDGKGALDISVDTEARMEKIFLYCLVWTVGGLLETDARIKFDAFLRTLDKNSMMPKCEQGMTIYEYWVHNETGAWTLWKPPVWNYPVGTEKLDFSNLLVPTMDSTRAIYNCTHMHKQKKSVCMVGGEGTAKTSTALMFFRTLDPAEMLVKRVNFSSATTPFMCQSAIEVELEK
eukprot:gene41586-50749_t